MASKPSTAFVVFVFCIVPLLGVQSAYCQQGTSNNGASENTEETSSYQKFLQYYKQAIDSPDVAQEEAIEWLKQDIKRSSTWEYKVLTLPLNKIEALEAELNKLGEERWECVSFVMGKSSFKAICKRRAQSYTGTIPLRELLK